VRSWVIAIAILAAGCKKKAGPAEDADFELTRALATSSIANIERAVDAARLKTASPDVEAGETDCAAVTSTFAKLREHGDGALAAKLEQLCTYELPVAELTAAAAAVEADANVCATTPLFARARDELKKAGRVDSIVTKLVSRYEARCPPPNP
jgi:hypothetical protein